ncbi:MAG: hypothetical protein CM1200mP24_10060 [Gammaproteobacteria bacterium]|nr:MAG: hypothetical protein CM1200mP24_10060 [Gammaproteobacteria bacterium]
MYFLPRIALVCATVVLISCKSNETDSAVDVLRETSAENQEKWFCQMAEDNPDAWDCVQDDVLAENPIPDRIPEGTLEKEQNDPHQFLYKMRLEATQRDYVLRKRAFHPLLTKF